MYKIGLTGGIASGKSTVLNWLKKKEIIYWDADAVARRVVVPDSKGLRALVEHFGEQILAKEGTLDREALGTLVFSSVDAKQAIDAIMHPLILECLEEDTKAYEAQGVSAMIYDIPLLFETGWDRLMDEIWLVDVSPSVQLKRLQERNQYSKEEARSRIASQMPLEEKRKRASLRIRNDGSKKALKKRLEILWNEKKHLFL